MAGLDVKFYTEKISISNHTYGDKVMAVYLRGLFWVQIHYVAAWANLFYNGTPVWPESNDGSK